MINIFKIFFLYHRNVIKYFICVLYLTIFENLKIEIQFTKFSDFNKNFFQWAKC